MNNRIYRIITASAPPIIGNQYIWIRGIPHYRQHIREIETILGADVVTDDDLIQALDKERIREWKRRQEYKNILRVQKARQQNNPPSPVINAKDLTERRPQVPYVQLHGTYYICVDAIVDPTQLNVRTTLYFKVRRFSTITYRRNIVRPFSQTIQKERENAQNKTGASISSECDGTDKDLP